MKSIITLLLSLVLCAGVFGQDHDVIAAGPASDATLGAIAADASACCTLRGDFNGDMFISLPDIMLAIAYAFQGGSPPPCIDHADTNADGKVNVQDILILIRYGFGMGPAPSPC